MPQPQERALRTQPPRALRRLVSHAAHPSGPRCSRPVARRKTAGLGVPGLPSPPCQPRSATRSERLESQIRLWTPLLPSAEGENVRSARKQLCHHLNAKSSLPTLCHWPGKRKGEAWGIAPRREPGLLGGGRERIWCRHVLVSPCPLRGGQSACPSGPYLGGQNWLLLKSPRGNPSLQFQHQRLDSATARERLGWAPTRFALAVPRTPRGGGQEVRQGAPKRGDSSAPFLQGFTCRVLGGAFYRPFAKTR